MTPPFVLRSLAGRATWLEPATMQGATIVVSPHPDDECLGCGGLVLRLRDAGLPVAIVHMTNGNRSHHRLMDPIRLAARRAAEAQAAAAVLGVTAGHLHLLGFDDGRLADGVASAARRLADIFDAVRPARVFVPYREELPVDHRAARAAARAALDDVGLRPQVYEYPVWFWNHWPLCRRWPASVSRLRHLSHGIRAEALLFRHFRLAVDVRAVLERKRAALACHATQMERQLPTPDWRVLGDVADGQWLRLFLTGAEFFHLARD